MHLRWCVIGLFSCSEEATRQLVSEGAIESVVALTSRADSNDVVNAAASLLLSIASDAPSLRPYLGRAGAVEYFIHRSEELVTSDGSSLHKYRVVDALCQCCRDANNRIKVREQGGLSVLTELLSNHKLTNIHDRIISALVCFLYDDASVAVLLQSPLVPTLVSHLYRVAGIIKKPDFIGQDSFDVCESLRTDLTEIAGADQELADDAYVCCNDLKSASDQPVSFSLDTEAKLNTDAVEFGIGEHSSDSAMCEPSAVGTTVLKTDQVNADNSCGSLEFELPPAVDESVVSEPDAVDLCARTPRYSINSPTYKAVSAWRMELAADGDEDSSHDRHSPRNIWEGVRLYADTFSALPPSCPVSVSPARSPGSCSDGLCSVRSWSSSLCDSSPRKSPAVSPAWSLDSSGSGMYSPFSNSSYVCLDGACSPSSLSDVDEAHQVSLTRYECSDIRLDSATGSRKFDNQPFQACDISVTEAHSKSMEISEFVGSVSDIGKQNDNASSSGNFSLSVDIDDDEIEDNVSVVQINSKSAVEEESGQQCSDDEFDAEAFQRRRQDERRFSRLLDIAKSMYASVETKPGLQAQQTKKRRRSSCCSSNTRHKFQCHDFSPKTCITEALGTNDPLDLPAKDLPNSSTTEDASCFTEAPQCLQTADDTNSGEISSDTESRASDDTSSCSLRHQNISQITERNIVTLLSRISHSPETVAHVMNAGTICGLLDYALLASHPLLAAGRTLLRLSHSHHGFQRALLCLFPLHAVWRMEPDALSDVPLSVSDNSCTDHHGRDLCILCVHQADSCVDHITPIAKTQSFKQEVTSSSEVTAVISEKENSSLSMQTHCSSIRSTEAERAQECVVSELCDNIIANLSSIAISRYGQGVVSHLLLRGSHCQRERCIISLCFLCRFVFFTFLLTSINRWHSLLSVHC